MAEIRIGTCSWADEALSKHWYPPGVKAGERLPYYAEHFDTVEVDSTYYRLPDESMVERWAARTPDEFVMHVKAFGLMTRHPVKLESLPPDLRGEAPTDERGRVERPSREFRAKVFRRFLDALDPLRSVGKLRGILFQFPSYVVYKDHSLDYLRWAREQLGDDEMLVEFRHGSWLDDEHRDDTLSFLDELREWIGPLRELSEQAEQAYAFFNNNATSPDGHGGRMAQAAANAKELQRLLQAEKVPVSAPS